MEEIIKRYLRKIYYNLKTCALWLFMAVLTGVAVGAFSSAFSFCLKKVTTLRGQYPFLLYFLPIGGVVIVFLYHLCGVRQDKGTNIIMTAVHGKNQDVPAYMAPLIFAATIITHLFGGSAGREGAALQMEEVLEIQSDGFSNLTRGSKASCHERNECRLFCRIWNSSCGLSDFPNGMISVGIMHYAALVPCVFSSIVANRFAVNMGINLLSIYYPREYQQLTFTSCAKIVLLGIFCAGLSVVFCIFLKGAGLFYNKFFKKPYMRIIVGGLLVIAITLLIGNYDYNGAGTDMIARAIEGNVPAYAFLIKMLLTALTLAAGYKGGEIVPAFFTGKPLAVCLDISLAYLPLFALQTECLPYFAV